MARQGCFIKNNFFNKFPDLRHVGGGLFVLNIETFFCRMS